VIKKIVWFTLFIIVIIAAILRFIYISDVPVSLYWDEAASTYNAFSIAQTGRDEYGTLLPLLFRSFDDYKMSGNIYLTAIVVKIFGVNEFSARATSAFFGTATVLLTFFLIREILVWKGDDKLKWSYQTKINASLFAAFLLSISPWHIQFSRTGFEANVAVFFVVAGALCFLKSFKTPRLFILSMILYSVSFYFYRSIHVFLPLFMLGSGIIFFSELKKLPRKVILVGIVLFTIILIPLLPWIFSKGGLARIRQVNLVTNSQEKVYDSAVKLEQQENGIVGTVIYNRRIVYITEFIKSYLSHFTPQFLFIGGDANGRHGPRGMGLLYLWELPFFVIGIILLVSISRKMTYFILLWIFLSPIAASVSIPSPHALRSLNILPMPQLLTTLGVMYSFLLLSKNVKKIGVAVLTIVILFFFVRYLNLYYNYTAKITSSDWADGYKQLTQYVFDHEGSYDKVIISGHYWQPYIYFLFYKSYDPALFQKTGSKLGFDKYIFGGTSWDKEQNSTELNNVNLKEMARAQKVLVALSPSEFESQKDHVKKLTEIKNHNNELVFIVAQTY
jgi:4-amino-4-deoxy-L-arabinose transferase-like glycosyltransferase